MELIILLCGVERGLMSNKDLKLRFCEKCKRKRFCKRERIPSHNFRLTCSKGHTWILKGITVERVMSVMEETFTRDKLKRLFDRDDTFYKSLK